MQPPFVAVEIDAPVATVTLSRPEARNALSPGGIAELMGALGALDEDDRVRAVVLTGGPKVFAAGADIAEMVTRTPADQLAIERGPRWQPLLRFTKPLIAAVNGYALGGGCELAMMCDMIIAGDGARFGQPEVNLGILPGAGGTQRWPRTAGKYVAMEANLTGDLVDAERAYQLGIANRVVPAAETVATAQELARRIAAKPPIAVRLIKEAVNAAYETTLTAGLAGERRSFHLLFATDDQTEGMRAFLDKRPPHFKGM
ncbi:enoyl-CoA hydratase-related protein [Actinacidiphila epipremni]|uniref:Enoyl-CoA hydratase n=1 Tax=Actinacidiphila epipremni TaxID=2053013 RepID=A0ABX0ZPD0_9ACTN|nr:enoyl-CoA hydratase-related protein [Actinacidiphila epipremni]NJP44647.1 enoyl-CoA hydratase [Actinacidiphila epipremni]